jgi:hypothetical protein
MEGVVGSLFFATSSNYVIPILGTTNLGIRILVKDRALEMISWDLDHNFRVIARKKYNKIVQS